MKLLFCRRRIFKYSQRVFIDFFHFLFIKHCSVNRAKLAYFNPLFLLSNVKTIEHFGTDKGFFRFWVCLISVMMPSQCQIPVGFSSDASDQSTSRYSHILGWSAWLRLTSSASLARCSFNFLKRFSVSLFKSYHTLFQRIYTFYGNKAFDSRFTPT